MSDRYRRLEVARSIDWRFLLPTPRLERVAWIGDIGADSEAALEADAVEFGHGAVGELARSGPWDVVVAEGLSADDARTLPAALELVRPGGWLLVNLPRGARARGARRKAVAALDSVGVERVERCWFVPDRQVALRIAPLDDEEAIRLMLARHGGRPTRRAAAAAARGLVGAGVPAELLGGEVSILARRVGGEPVSGWPSLEPLAALVASELGTQSPSWILLTPRFAASAHVVILLLKDGKVRLVAKIARVAGGEGPRHEARMLAALSEAGMPPGSAPRVVATTDLSGHGAVLEEAVQGRPLDRRLLRADPGRWIGSVMRWLEDLPRAPRDAVVSLDELVRDPLERLRARWPQDRDLAALVARTLGLLESLEHQPLPAVFEHGDLSHPNLLVRADGGLGVLDWELARPDGMPLHDLSFFLGYVALAAFGERDDPYEGLERVLADRTLGAVPALHTAAARFGIDRAAVPALIVICWARALAGLVERASAGAESGPPSSSRYYRMWEGAVDRTAQLGALIH